MQNFDTTDVQFVFKSTNTLCFSNPLDTALTHMYIFSVSVLILDSIIIKLCYVSLADWTSADEHESTSPLQALLVIFFFFFDALCIWCEMAGHLNNWTSLKAAPVSPQSRLSSQRLRAEPEVLRSHPLPLQRPAESVVGAAAIVCRAGVLPPTCSEDLQKASELRAQMLSVPGTVNMLGIQTMKGMWNLVPRWGLFVINAEVWGQIQLVAGEVNTPYVQSWAQFSIQRNASLVFHPTL